MTVLRARSPINIAIALVGVALLVVTVQRAGGWLSVVSGIASIGWWFVVVVLLGAARMAARARAWMACAGDPNLRFRDAFGAILAGDTAGNLTPLGVLASEPTKILLARSRIPTVTSISSVTIENAFYIASVLIVLLAGGTATSALLGKEGITRLRGKWFDFAADGASRPIPALATFHPSYLLRSPQFKKDAWRDLLSLQSKLEELP